MLTEALKTEEDDALDALDHLDKKPDARDDLDCLDLLRSQLASLFPVVEELKPKNKVSNKKRELESSGKPESSAKAMKTDEALAPVKLSEFKVTFLPTSTTASTSTTFSGTKKPMRVIGG